MKNGVLITMRTRLLFLTFCFSVVGCKKSPLSGPWALQEYSEEILEPISKEDQVGIEAAYLERYGSDIRWCLPLEAERFDSFDELDRYVNSHIGWRCYGKFGEAYLLVSFYGGIGAIFPAVDYELNLGGVSGQNHLLDNGPDSCWNIRWSNDVFLYEHGNLTEVPESGGIWDLSQLLPDLSYEEASIIPRRHKAYNDHYFGKFMIEGETNPDQALFRILDEVDPDQSLRFK